uniref:Uncharacterized protein n=1 Tax=virus sp. ctmTa7 TaxID=2828255 RepID=A0A8S5RC09_9VIRU|nr:MAG TPA: hypothetical protein [virus sp. ctmTa7]
MIDILEAARYLVQPLVVLNYICMISKRIIKSV